MPFMFGIATPPVFNDKLRSTLTSLGLTTNLQLCLDAGDIASAASSTPDKWLDTSGVGTDFYLGSGTGADAADPTFNGTVGGQSSGEYWSFDGGDYFTHDAANPAWVETLHKDAAIFSFMAWVRTNAPGAVDRGLFGTSGGSAAGTGIAAYYRAPVTPVFALKVLNAGALAKHFMPGTALENVGWNFIAMAVDESGDVARYNINGTATSGTAAYSSPAAGSASQVLQISALGNADSPADSGDRLSQIAMWQGTALTAANLDAIYQMTRGKFNV